MNIPIQNKSREQDIWWLPGIVGGLLLISLGLELLAHQVFGQTDIGTLLWALYVSFWSFVVGVAGFLFLAARWLIQWRHDRANPVTMNRLFAIRLSLHEELPRHGTQP